MPVYAIKYLLSLSCYTFTLLTPLPSCVRHLHFWYIYIYIYIYIYPSVSSHPHKDSLHSTDCLLCELWGLCNQTSELSYQLTGLRRFIAHVPKKDRSYTDAVSLLVQRGSDCEAVTSHCRLLQTRSFVWLVTLQWLEGWGKCCKCCRVWTGHCQSLRAVIWELLHLHPLTTFLVKLTSLTDWLTDPLADWVTS